MHKVEFATPPVLKPSLERRVESLLQGQATKDGWLIYTKAVIFLTVAAWSYYSLVFNSHTVSAVLFWATLLALSVDMIGFNIQHDGNHGSFSRFSLVNRLAGMSLDIIGVSSYFWGSKHCSNHHVHTNIPQRDPDIELGLMARLSTEHQWRWYHQYQHIYLWGLYSLVHLRYLYSDFQRIFLGKRDDPTLDFPRGADQFRMIAGKLVFICLAFVLPIMIHPRIWYLVLIVYLGISLIVGFVFSVVFQLAHTVDLVEHPDNADILSMPEWSVHECRTTANFATSNPLLGFFLGGLNYQVEHHLLPKLAHTRYPKIAQTVRAVCVEHGVPYYEHRTLRQALMSHYRFLRKMGRLQSDSTET